MKYKPVPASGIQTKLLIGGNWVDGVARSTIDVIDPFSGKKIAAVAEAQEEDVDRAVEAAERAFPAWSRLAAHERGRLLLKLADRIEADADYLARLESQNTGHPIRDCLSLDVPRTVLCFRYFGGMADKLEGSTIPVDAGFLNYVEREALGVVG
jgi:aldehyde dehydrogenase (NAD+)